MKRIYRRLIKTLILKVYRPKFKRICGGVEVYFCVRLTKIRSYGGVLLAPIRFYTRDEILDELVPYIRTEFIKRFN